MGVKPDLKGLSLTGKRALNTNLLLLCSGMVDQLACIPTEFLGIPGLYRLVVGDTGHPDCDLSTSC